MNLRIVTPELLVDISTLPELRGIKDDGGYIRIGAAVRYQEILASPIVAANVPLLLEALRLVAHVAIRNRGTLGGSLAFADPAAELPACAVALDATIHIASRGGRRMLPAAEFFTGMMSNALQVGELIESVTFPKIAPTAVTAILELSRRQGDYAMAGVVATAMIAEGKISQARIVFFGCTSHARRAVAVARVLEGAVLPLPEATNLQLASAVEQDIDPSDSPGCSATTRSKLAITLMKRIVGTLAERVRPIS